MPQPWECPRCKRINAPTNPSCFCSPTGSPTLIQQKSETTHECKHESDGLCYTSNPPKLRCAKCGMFFRGPF